jgi:low affinity Fe/Cu permease
VMSVWRRIASRAPAATGNPWTFLVALAVTVGWVVTGPVFDWSGNWILIPATVTSVGAFLLVLLLQYTQNRDTRAVQLKLDELIRSLADARNEFVRLEQRPDEELGAIEEGFEELSAELQEKTRRDPRRRERFGRPDAR